MNLTPDELRVLFAALVRLPLAMCDPGYRHAVTAARKIQEALRKQEQPQQPADK